LDADMEAIEGNLKVLNEQGYHNYGTTIRPIRCVNEFETSKGHRYIPIDPLMR